MITKREIIDTIENEYSEEANFQTIKEAAKEISGVCCTSIEQIADLALLDEDFLEYILNI